MTNSLTLTEAQRLILELARPTPPEDIELDNALGRIAAAPLRAALPVPSFDHSTRDGYAVKANDLRGAGAGHPISLKVTGEIAAGDTDLPRLARGTALRIMTGAALPEESDLVLTQEEVERTDQTIIVSRAAPAGGHIRRKGSDLAGGETIVRPGTVLAPAHLAQLATAGIDRIKVHKRAAAAVVCTGSELVSREQPPRPGQVISGNRLLLDGLIRSAGGVTGSRATVPDRTETIAAKLAELIGARVPLIITTGGVGPGKFDLMREVFNSLEIKTVYDSLQIRPGRATILGVLAESMIFALPGPPPAVNLLFHELVKPALLKSNGSRGPFTKSLRAELAETITREPGNLLLLKEGEYSLSRAKLLVRPVGAKAEANCILPLPPGSKRFEKGELLTIHPTAQLF